MMKAIPLPVSIALAGQMIACFCRNETASSITAQVTIEKMICGNESPKWNWVFPRTYRTRNVAETWSRGSFGDGRMTGYDRPATRSDLKGARGSPATSSS